MDAVMDLTARAVTFIVLIQDTLKKQKVAEIANSKFSLIKPLSDFKDSKTRVLAEPFFQKNALEVIWISYELPNKAISVHDYCFHRCEELINWLAEEQHYTIFEHKLENCQYFPAPEQWREAIREILFEFPEERIQLANALHYLPLYSVLALGGAKYEVKQQRLLQVWFIPDDADKDSMLKSSFLDNMLTKADQKRFKGILSQVPLPLADIRHLLIDHDKLIEKLENEKVPLPFEYILGEELHEISAARERRLSEICQSSLNNEKHTESFEYIFRHALKKHENDDNADVILDDALDKAITESSNAGNSEKIYSPDVSKKFNKVKDPYAEAKDMNLWALALSGGGIRSATFNLGILQGLAKNGLLSKIDYLSTVSGGGYIGSWFVSWIKRNESVLKVSDRLNETKSTDPFAEEVRPIRWLRMFSNYLAPNTGIMSLDSWTVGMTLLRNMLLNQLVILGLFLTVLSASKVLYLVWITFPKWKQIPIFDHSFTLYSSFFLIAAAFLAGLGMSSYHDSFPKIPVGNKLKKLITKGLFSIGCLVALLLSAWIFEQSIFGKGLFSTFENKFEFFLPTVAVGFLALIAVSFMGRYDKCIPLNGMQKQIGILLGIFFTVAAVMLGACFLIAVWKIAENININTFAEGYTEYFSSRLAFTFLPPLIIEVLSLTIVLRMALLGDYFPDERREWWGRMGAVVHRVALFWIIITGATLLGMDIISSIKSEKINQFFAVGWGATVLSGLKAAFSNKTSGDTKSKGVIVTILEILALVAPYLFGLGLLMFLPGVLDILVTQIDQFDELHLILPASFYRWVLFIETHENKAGWNLVLLVLLAILTMLLSWRIGVNQFSMHLFYKNRLVRAFLGASRLRQERQKSANPFTGFDRNDDVSLAELTTKKNYFGPYPLINTTLNASSSELDRQDRKAESFIFSPHYCGFDFSKTRSLANISKKTYDFAYRQTDKYGYPDGGVHLGTAMAISGAAASPNQGFHSSMATSFLLSLFNIRLGWWMGNPRKSKWQKSDPKVGLSYIIADLAGKSNTSDEYVCLSDGGHFDNMGLYELIRRKCKYIILGDGEQDEQFSCEGLANAIRRCRIDFGVEISFDNLSSITNLSDNRYSTKQYTFGHIKYPGDISPGILLYIKASIIGKESVDVKEYAIKNQDFPHQTTGDQFFNEAQFESYRKLGVSIMDEIL